MSHLLPMLAILASLTILVFFLELLRRARVLAQYALLWLLGSIIILVISAFWGPIRSFANSLGVVDAPWLLLFAAGFLLALIIQIANTIAISEQAQNNRDLAQRTAMLEWYVRQLRKQVQQLVNSPVPCGPGISGVSLAKLELDEQVIQAAEETVLEEETIHESI